jgi:S1-C subfamily serine protease
MKLFSSGIDRLLGAIIFTFISFLPFSKAKAQISVGEVAQQITVQIMGEGRSEQIGSGVIVQRNGNIYTVLTDFHVVGAAGTYTVRTSDGIIYSLTVGAKLPDINLVTAQFQSNTRYAVAQLGNSEGIKLADSVYVGGYPKPGLNIDTMFVMMRGDIVAASPTYVRNGYTMAHSTSTRLGMEGGPILNRAGEVIAIQGRMEPAPDSLVQPGVPQPGAWVNLGIPMSFYKKTLPNVSVAKLAQKITVKIQGQSERQIFGSGVIIQRSGNVYTVLTVEHVVAQPEQYSIQTPDGKKYPLHKRLPNLPYIDLAAVQFISAENYPVVQLGDSTQIKLGSMAYVAGYPKPSEQNLDKQLSVFTITRGYIATVLPKEITRDGYSVAYDNLTRTGMSGGPVLNEVGELIAIHGRRESERNGDRIRAPWLSLGIPVNFYRLMPLGDPQGLP